MRTLCRYLSLVLLAVSPTALAALGAPASQPAASPDSISIITIAAVHALRDSPPSAPRPVSLRGVVTYLSTVPPMMFVQDATGGVGVMGPRDREIKGQVKPGVTVIVEGEAVIGGNGVYVTGAGKDPVKVTVEPEVSQITAEVVPLGKLSDPSVAGRLVDVSGVVRAIRTEAGAAAAIQTVILTLAAGKDRAEVAVLAWPAAREVPNALVGSTIRVRGVFNTAWPARQQMTAMRLLAAAKELHIVTLATTRPFELATTSVATLNAWPVEEAIPIRLRLSGVVTAVVAKGMYVQDGTAGVWIETPPGDVPVTSRLDLVGFPVRRGSEIVIENAEWNLGETGPLPQAPLVTGEQAMAGAMDARLVRVEALVLAVSRLAEGQTLVLQSGERVFLARAASPAAGALGEVTENSWVRVTGVCVNNRRPGTEEALSSAQPVSFHLLVGSADGVEIIRAPSWLTLARALTIAGVFAAVTLAAFGWVAALRRRVARQTHLIREHLARETLNEERMRIARELHDSLEQDLLAITMQLSATERLLDEPQRAKQSLHLAAAMVRRSQSETHRAVWDLRARNDDSDGMISTLRQAVAGLSPAAGPVVEVNVNGEECPLSPQMENHLLRVALEAVTNAIKHAKAKRIEVGVTFIADEIAVRVSDDGRGFDTDHLPPPTSGHFGLFGMKERAEKLNGKLSIRSRAGSGSEIELVVPLQTGNGVAG